MKQITAQRISQAIHDWRDAESLLFAETPLGAADMKVIDGKHIGIRITLAVKDRKKSLVAKLQEAIKELETVAFKSKDSIDYLEVLRVKTDDEEIIAIEVVERTEKRNTWVNGE